MADHPEDDDAALRVRLDKLSASLPGGADTRPTQSPPPKSSMGDANAMGAGFRVVTELIAGVLVGGGIGWLLDKLFHTKPILMIVLGALGLVGGFWNIIRTAMLPADKGTRGKGFGKE